MTDTAVLKEKLESHCRESESDKRNIKLWLKSVEDTVENIRDNHLQHLDTKIDGIDEKVTKLEIKLTEIKVNQKWMMLIGGALGGGVSGLATIISQAIINK